MKNNKKLAYAALAVFASSAYAEGVAPEFNGKGTASVEVKNTLDIVETASLNFGTIAAVAGDDTAAAATLKLVPATGELTSDIAGTQSADKTAGSITAIDKTNVSPGIFTVSNAAKYTNLNITLPKDADTIELKMENAAPESLKFTLSNFEAATNDGPVKLTDGKGPARTDSNGNLVLLVGATLSTEKAGSAAYDDAVYSGTYAVTIKY